MRSKIQCDAIESMEVRMADVIDRLVKALNAHDVDAAAALIHPQYRSAQPVHPSRAFTGRAQMHANWTAMLTGIPDFHADVLRSVDDGPITWTEWHWSGTRTDGQPFDVRGITLFEIANDLIVSGTLYLEDVERERIGIQDAVESLSGQRPPDE
jgi:limonene-1,2-epoxide hydrolase